MAKAKENTPGLWDEIWKGNDSESIRAAVRGAKKGLLWKRVRHQLLSNFRRIDGLRTIEVGAGLGTFSCLLAQEGANVCVLDYSQAALDSSRRAFEGMGIKAEWVLADALALPEELKGKFDVAMSFGTAEHFSGGAREKILHSHVGLVNSGGMAIISVPNAWNFPYRIMKTKLEHQGRWAVGEEYPFSRWELRKFCRKQGWRDYGFLGDSFLYSFNNLSFLHPVYILRRTAGRWPKGAAPPPLVRHEWASPLDSFISYAIVLCIRKSEAGLPS